MILILELCHLSIGELANSRKATCTACYTSHWSLYLFLVEYFIIYLNDMKKKKKASSPELFFHPSSGFVLNLWFSYLLPILSINYGVSFPTFWEFVQVKNISSEKYRSLTWKNYTFLIMAYTCCLSIINFLFLFSIYRKKWAEGTNNSYVTTFLPPKTCFITIIMLY